MEGLRLSWRQLSLGSALLSAKKAQYRHQGEPLLVDVPVNLVQAPSPPNTLHDVPDEQSHKVSKNIGQVLKDQKIGDIKHITSLDPIVYINEPSVKTRDMNFLIDVLVENDIKWPKLNVSIACRENSTSDHH
jgi:hypothetical protein